MNSALPRMSQPVSALRARSRIKGVWPTAARKPSLIPAGGREAEGGAGAAAADPSLQPALLSEMLPPMAADLPVVVAWPDRREPS